MCHCINIEKNSSLITIYNPTRTHILFIRLHSCHTKDNRKRPTTNTYAPFSWTREWPAVHCWRPSCHGDASTRCGGATTAQVQFALDQQHGFVQFDRLYPCKEQLSCLKMFRQREKKQKDDEQVWGDYPSGDWRLATNVRSLNFYFYSWTTLYPWSAPTS
jgi:hypothetical protein